MISSLFSLAFLPFRILGDPINVIFGLFAACYGITLVHRLLTVGRS